MKGMKGFVFTVDAVFALIIASVATTLLLYINFYSPIVYGTAALDVSGVTQSLLSTTIGTMCTGIYLGNVPACGASAYGNNVSFGTYQVGGSDSVLQALATLYLTSGAGPYATLIMEKLYPSYNAGLYINSSFAPSINLQTGSFDKSPAFYAPNSPTIAFTFTESQWFYLYSQIDPASGVGAGMSPITDVYNGTVNNGIGGGQPFDYASVFAGGPSNSLTYGEYWPENWQQCPTATNTIHPGTWYNAVVTVRNYNNVTLYINGVKENQCMFNGVTGLTPTRTSIGIGDNPPGGNELANASIGNVQFYNQQLPYSDIVSLYRNGVTGGPVTFTDLIGWWPLDGNANDYSGNGNNGTFSSATYTSMLAGNYIPASLVNAYQVSKATAPTYINAGTANSLYNTSVILWH